MPGFNAGKVIHGILAIPKIHHPPEVQVYPRGSGFHQNNFLLHRST